MSLKEEYSAKIMQELKQALWKNNSLALPKIDKIIVNVWVWSYLQKWKRTIEDVIDMITKITGQKPLVVNSRVSVSNFKLKKWVPNWIKVTLRWKKMFDFIEKLITVCLPRIRDFRWVSKKAFDTVWNYTLWISDITVFPEIDLDDISKSHWIQIVFSIKNSNKDDSFKLLKAIWLPFEK